MILTIANPDLESYESFLQEAREHLENMEDKILAMEGGPAELVDEVFRGLHSIKGVASFLQLTAIQKLSHKLESVFDSVRMGKLSIRPSLVQDCLRGVDALKSLIGDLEEKLAVRKPLPDGTFQLEVAEWAEPEAAPREEQEPAGGQAPEEALITPEMKAAFCKESLEQLEETEQIFLEILRSSKDADLLPRAFRLIHSFKGNCGFFGFPDMERLSHRLESVLERWKQTGIPEGGQELETSLSCLDALRQACAGVPQGRVGGVDGLEDLMGRLETLLGGPGGPAAAPAAQASPSPRPPAVEAADPAGAAKAAGSGPAEGRKDPREGRKDLRVDVGKLDLLLDLVGELVIASSIVKDHPELRGFEHEGFDRSTAHLSGIIADLQNVVLGLRLVPAETVFKKMTRLVHDQALKSAKKVRLDIRGEKTEIDKNIAELIADPLVHMIRNAIDHGLESPEARAAAGKDPVGTVTLEARQEGNDVCVTLRDDGKGMDRARILAKAREKGLLGDGGEGLKDEEVFQFIFMPGFSTAEQVTSTSGRGVGMDVVKSNIEKLRGKIIIASEPGGGTTLDLRIPLTLSITEGMQVRVGDSLFILPLAFIRETLSPRREQITRSGDEDLLLLRGKLHPILRLGSLYGIEGTAGIGDQGILLLIETRERMYCLFVDELMGMRQTVVKSLPPYLGTINGASGCSILPDGEICLILDLEALWSNRPAHPGNRRLGSPPG